MKMKCTLHAKPAHWEDSGFEFTVFAFDDLSTQGYIACDTVEVEFKEPPREILVGGAVAAFREEQKRIRAEAQMKVTALEDAIQKLLCIEHKPEPQA